MNIIQYGRYRFELPEEFLTRFGRVFNGTAEQLRGVSPPAVPPYPSNEEFDVNVAPSDALDDAIALIATSERALRA